MPASSGFVDYSRYGWWLCAVCVFVFSSLGTIRRDTGPSQDLVVAETSHWHRQSRVRLYLKTCGIRGCIYGRLC